VRSRVAECCAALGGALDAAGIRWFLFGAQAAILRGVRRFTADVDVTVDLGARPIGDLITPLAAAGVVLRVADADEFVRATRVLPMRHGASGLPVDVVLSGPGFEERFFARATTVEIDGVSIPVARAEDLVVMKVLAGRALDIEDAVAMLAADELDAAGIRADLRELELMLDQSDLLPLFEACCRRAHASRTRGG
jgi:hypothetical protein